MAAACFVHRVGRERHFRTGKREDSLDSSLFRNLGSLALANDRVSSRESSINVAVNFHKYTE